MIRAIVAVFLSLTVTLPALAQEAPVEFDTDQKKISYVLGAQVGDSLRRQGIVPDVDALVQGIKDILSDNELRFSVEEQQQIFEKFQMEQQRKAAISSLGEDAWKVQLEKPEMMTFDRDNTLTAAARSDWDSNRGGGQAVQPFFGFVSVVDADDLVRRMHQHRWGIGLLAPPMQALNRDSSPYTGQAGIEQRGTPRGAGQQSLELH